HVSPPSPTPPRKNTDREQSAARICPLLSQSISEKFFFFNLLEKNWQSAENFVCVSQIC
ncbi:hypothetical protein HAX54_042589, partial [Datura stramonium]|nr:hypothetical protein [Datura stramonium]